MPTESLSVVDGEWPDRASPGALTCPICGFYYSHIRDVFTRLGQDPHEATVYPGTRPIGLVPDERRSALIVCLDGECGHQWELQIQQHKGINLLQSVPVLLPPLPAHSTRHDKP